MEWYSEQPEIAQVDTNGIVTGIKEGKTKIIVKSCDIKELIEIHVSLTGNSFCSNKEDPLTGTYHTRLLLHGYENDESDLRISDLFKTIELTLIFRAEGDDIYYGEVNEEWHTIHRRWSGGRYVVDVGYSNTTSKLQWYEYGYINCSLDGYYKTSQHDMLLHIYIFPEKREVVADDIFAGDQIIYGVGTF